jgi:uncharacterized membrane protein (DUF4010 family)
VLSTKASPEKLLMDWSSPLLVLACALGCGMLIGIERGWSQRNEEPGNRVAGLRTFSLLGLIGGIAALVTRQGAAWLGGAMAFGAVAILVIGYSRVLAERRDATTAVSALLVSGIGAIAGLGLVSVALAAAAATVLVLALRDELHGFVARLDAQDVKALARFAVIALAIYPFLPDRDMGPLDAWNPSELWLVIVAVTGFSFAGYVANRAFGIRHGTVATAIIGGAYSSTAVTQALAQRLGQAERFGAEAAGIALASAVMYLRVIALVAVLADRMLPAFALLVAPSLAVAFAAGWWLYRRAPMADAPPAPGNPVALLPALGFVLFVAVAAVAARWAEERFGDQGIALLLFLMGAVDVDASIITAGRLPASAIGAELAAIAIGGTIIANMTVKIGVTLAYARKAGRIAAAALLASTAVLVGSLLVGLLRL